MAKELIITRVFDASKEKVWAAWTTPEEVKKWWGPKDFTCPSAQLDVRVGGKYLVAMRGPAGSQWDKDMWSTGTYQEVIPNEKLVVTDSFADPQGNVVPSTYYGMEGMPLESRVEVTFEDEEEDDHPERSRRTKMTLHYPDTSTISEENYKGMSEGWNQCFDKLQASLE